jgi:hypothetical protein
MSQAGYGRPVKVLTAIIATFRGIVLEPPADPMM